MKGWNIAVIIILSVIIGILLGRTCFKSPTIEYHTKTDTLYVEKIIVDSVPKEVAKTIVRTEYVPIKDTLYIHDSVFVKIPIEQKVYETEDYKAIVSGYKPSLDYMEVRAKEIHINSETVRKTKWGLGFSLGYGIAQKPSPYIGVSLNYNIISW